MAIIKEGRCSLGICYIEDCGTYFMVYIGSTKYGPYSTVESAMRKFREFCL